MILSNAEIQAAIDAGRLIIRPEPMPRNPAEGKYCPYDTHSVDLTLADEISIPDSGTFSYDLMQEGSIAKFIQKNSETKIIDPSSGYCLERNRFILGMTREWIELPTHLPINQQSGTCLAARIEGKSSRARCGLLVHFTAPTVHPDFKGNLTLEIINLGPAGFTLRRRMPIAQLIVEEVKGSLLPTRVSSSSKCNGSA
jgi:dCTP deaminase